MRLKKIAFLLCVLIGCQMCSVTAIADGSTGKSVQFLQALGIIELDEYSDMLWDDSLVKRKEMAEILCRLFRVEPTKDAVPRFLDVAEEDRAYIETAVRNGYMSGYSENEFGTTDYVTNEQMLKIFVSALGGDSLALQYGGYPNGYIRLAEEMGITKNMKAGYNLPARRIDLADLVYEIMHTDILQSKCFGKYQYVEGETFLTEALNVYRYNGIVSENDITSINRSTGTYKNCVRVGNEVYSDTQYLMENYLGYHVNIYVEQPDENELANIIYVEPSNKNTDILVKAEDLIRDIKRDSFVVNYYKGDTVKNIEISEVADMIYNGKAVKFDMTRLNNLTDGEVLFIDNDGDKSFDVISIMEYTTGVIYKIDAENMQIYLNFAEPAISLKNSTFKIYRDGKRADISELGIGDVISVFKSDEESGKLAYTIKASTEAVMGTISETLSDSDKDYVVIKKKQYEISPYCKQMIQDGKLDYAKTGISGTFYMDVDGRIAYYSLDTKENKVGYLIRGKIIDGDDEPILLLEIFSAEDGIKKYTVTDRISIDGQNIKVYYINKNSDIIEKLSIQQLIQYKDTDGVLNKIVFPVNGYDAHEFSLDLDASTSATKIPLTSKSLLDHKYYVTSATKAFAVPGPLDDGGIDMDPAHYKVNTGTYFATLNNQYAVKLYDVEENGFVRYVVYTRWWGLDGVSETNPIVAVKSTADGVDEDGNIIKIIKGVNESGKEISLKARYPEKVADIRRGDIIQYANDYSGAMHDAIILHSWDSEMYKPEKMGTMTNASCYKVYGKVVRITPDSMQLCSTEHYSTDMSPLDIDRLVLNNSAAVLCYDKQNARFTPISFGEINQEDLVFAVISGENKTRMLVVYR